MLNSHSPLKVYSKPTQSLDCGTPKKGTKVLNFPKHFFQDFLCNFAFLKSSK